MTDADGVIGRFVAASDPAMVVVTTCSTGSGERDGCLVGFHSQSSISPERYVVWLSRANRTARLARSATHLAVHLLSASDTALAERFGGITGDDLAEGGDGKLAGLRWSDGLGGVPVLDDVARRFVGLIVARDDGAARDGDHEWLELEAVHGPAEGDEADHAPLRLAAVTAVSPGHEA